MDKKRERLDDKNNFNIKTYHSFLRYDPSRLIFNNSLRV